MFQRIAKRKYTNNNHIEECSSSSIPIDNKDNESNPFL